MSLIDLMDQGTIQQHCALQHVAQVRCEKGIKLFDTKIKHGVLYSFVMDTHKHFVFLLANLRTI